MSKAKMKARKLKKSKKINISNAVRNGKGSANNLFHNTLINHENQVSIQHFSIDQMDDLEEELAKLQADYEEETDLSHSFKKVLDEHYLDWINIPAGHKPPNGMIEANRLIKRKLDDEKTLRTIKYQDEFCTLYRYSCWALNQHEFPPQMISEHSIIKHFIEQYFEMKEFDDGARFIRVKHPLENV